MMNLNVEMKQATAAAESRFEHITSHVTSRHSLVTLFSCYAAHGKL